jgi:hypothetical protein
MVEVFFTKQKLKIERYNFLRRVKMGQDIMVIVMGAVLFLTCILIANLAPKNKEKTAVTTILGTVGVLLVSLGASFLNTGNPAGMDELSTKPIYAIQARFPCSDGINSVVVVKKDAEKPGSGFRLMMCKSKELPDANLVRVESEKFIPFTLCQKIQ